MPSKYLWQKVSTRLIRLPKLLPSSLLLRACNPSQVKFMSRVSGALRARV